MSQTNVHLTSFKPPGTLRKRACSSKLKKTTKKNKKKAKKEQNTFQSANPECKENLELYEYDSQVTCHTLQYGRGGGAYPRLEESERKKEKKKSWVQQPEQRHVASPGGVGEDRG